jgi:hypothetical protein
MLSREASKRPYPATWLNGKRWEDEPETPPPQAVNGPKYEFWNGEVSHG